MLREREIALEEQNPKDRAQARKDKNDDTLRRWQFMEKILEQNERKMKLKNS